MATTAGFSENATNTLSTIPNRFIVPIIYTVIPAGQHSVKGTPVFYRISREASSHNNPTATWQLRANPQSGNIGSAALTGQAKR
jgi:hypothetical protein